MNPPLPTIVHRQELQMTSGLEVDGVWRNAGAVYTLRGHPALDSLIPADWSVSWTTLPDQRPLDPHLHPIESHIAIVNGQARLTGQQQLIVNPGTVVQVPPWHLHGFSCAEDKAFWAITWQRSPQSLFYEDGLVYFETSKAAREHLHRDSEERQVALHRCQTLPSDDVMEFRIKSAMPEFFAIDLTTKESVKIQTLGPTLIFATVADSDVSIGATRYHLAEGDTFAFDGANLQTELCIRRDNPIAQVGLLIFPESCESA